MSEVNECQPITIFPLGIACQTTNPSSPKATNGNVSIIVTGGTPPYNILWGNGNSSFTINNLSVGSYPVFVSDYYGDFTANTTCVLTASATTTTTTSTTTVQPTYDFCLTISYFTQVEPFNVLESIHFNPNGLVGGYQSWISDDSNYTITWNSIDSVWQLNDYGPTIVSTNPAYPPLNDWAILGYKGNVTAEEGECSNAENLDLKVNINSSTCENCDGVISLDGIGGVPPYQYSINGGDTWSESGLFQNLCPSVAYNIKVKDDEGTIFTPPVNSTILFQPTPTITYTLAANTSQSILQYGGLNQTYSIQSTTNFILVNPIPVGSYITFSVDNLNEFVRSITAGTYSNATTYTFLKNGNPIVYSTQQSSVSTTPNTLKGCGDYSFYRTDTITSWNGITITNGDVISLVVTSTVTKVLEPCYGCCYRFINNSVSVKNTTISNCQCCNVQTSTNVLAPPLV